MQVIDGMEDIIHRGKIVKKEIEASGIPISTIAKRLEINRMTFYNKLNNPNMPLNLVKKVGEIINFDFSVHFPEDINRTTSKGGEPLPDDVEGLKRIVQQRDSEISQLKDQVIELSRKLIEILYKFYCQVTKANTMLKRH